MAIICWCVLFTKLMTNVRICVAWLLLGMYFKEIMMMPPVIGLARVDIGDTCGNKKNVLPFSPKDTPKPLEKVKKKI